MDTIISNWPIIVAIVCMICTVVMAIISFCQRPTSEQLVQVKEWLLLIVLEAERLFGSQMGKIKLRYAYDKFIEKFGYLSRLISFEKFSELVDVALAEMKELLKSNKRMQEYVGVTIPTSTTTEATEAIEEVSVPKEG